MKYYYLASLALVALILGCTADSDLLGHGSYSNPMLSEDYIEVFQASDLPGVSYIVPAQNTGNFSVSGVVSIYFNNDWGYSDFYVGLYERETMEEASFDITTFDSSSAKDFGIKVMSALKPFTEYVVRLESISNGTVYYINYTTGEADTAKPYVEYAQTSGKELEIFFSERINTSTLTSENVIVSGKEGDFDNIMVSAYYMEQSAYINFNLSYYESYNVTIKGVKDLSGNIMDEQNITIHARI